MHTSARVKEVTAGGVKLGNGTFLPADLIVSAAGSKGPDVLTTLDGLETNRANQLVVLPRLQTTRDPNIFAIGDCAASPWVAGKTVPPRAQAARQQASHLARQLKRLLAERKVKPWRYRISALWSRWAITPVGRKKSDMSLSKPINVVQPAEDRFHNDLSA